MGGDDVGSVKPALRLERTIMKWIVATIGALIVTLGAFLAVMMIPVVLFPAVYKSAAGLVAMYCVGIPLAIVAGAASFRATLKQYAK
jgi:hypothetical protein